MKKVLLLLALLSTSAYAGDAEAGKKVYQSKKINCAQCHGADGMGMAKMGEDGKWKLSLMKGPRIAGLSEKDTETALLQIQDADRKKLRKTKFTSMMKSRVKKLDAKEIKDLAAYVSKLLNPAAGAYKSEM